MKLFKTQLVYFGFYTFSIFPVLQSAAAGIYVVTGDGPGSPGLGSAPPISCCHYTNCLHADSQHFISSIHPESIPLEYLNCTNILIFRPIHTRNKKSLSDISPMSWWPGRICHMGTHFNLAPAQHRPHNTLAHWHCIYFTLAWNICNSVFCHNYTISIV